MTLSKTYVTREEFDALPEYSCTVPTGTAIGKKWKRHTPYRRPDSCIRPTHNCGHWFMGEYVRDPDPEMVGIHWTMLIITGEPVPQSESPRAKAWCPEED